MKIGWAEDFCASSARQRTAAAAPSLTPRQAKRPRIAAPAGGLDMGSVGASLRNCAFAFFAPFLWFFQAMRASTCFSWSSSTPYFLAYAGARSENVAGAVMLELVPSLGGFDPTRPE